PQTDRQLVSGDRRAFRTRPFDSDPRLQPDRAPGGQRLCVQDVDRKDRARAEGRSEGSLSGALNNSVENSFTMGTVSTAGVSGAAEAATGRALPHGFMRRDCAGITGACGPNQQIDRAYWDLLISSDQD